MNGKESAVDISRQISAVLTGLSPEDYTAPLNIFEGGTLGKHFRHIIDFYLCLLRDANLDIVDFANRDRNPLIEQNPRIAQEMINEIAERVKGLDENQSIRVKAEFSANPNQPRPIFQTSIGRELMYAYDHALHHLAIIRIGLREQRPDMPIAQEFGVAPSTIKYERGHHSRG